MAEIKKISTEFQLLDKFLDTSGDAGSANQVLVSTATGVDWVDGSGSAIIGGPYVTIGTNQTVTGIKSFSGKIGADGGIDGLTLANGGITGSNYDITGVNQLVISDPGEGIVFTGTATMYLNAVDDATDSILKLTNATQLNLNSTARITSLVNPTGAQDAATKNYVDTEIGNIPSGLAFEGNWNASTDTPTLAGTTQDNGKFWIVSVAGSTNLSGITDWAVGDWAIYVDNGAGTDAWQKVDNSSTLSGLGAAGKVAFWSTTSNVSFNNNFSYDGTYLTSLRIRVGDGTDGFFYSDTAGRTAFTGGDFYIQSGVTNYFNYATNIYLGDNTGDNVLFRGSTITGTNWGITSAGAATFTTVTGTSGTFSGTVTGGVSTSNVDGQANIPFKLSVDYNSYMVAAAGNTWGLFWAGNSGARYGTNGNGGPGNIWGNSGNPNEFTFVGSDSTAWTVYGNNGNVWQKGDLWVNGGDITLGGTGRIQGVDTVSASTDAANKAYVDASVPSLANYVTLNTAQTISGVKTFSANNIHSNDTHITFGPNSTWNSYLRVGGNGHTATGTEMASIATTNGNLHLDSADDSSAMYLNFYAGTGGVKFGNGANGVVATMTSAGALSMNSDLTVSGGDIILGGTGRIQGVDTVSAGTDAANKTYVDNAVAGVPQGDITAVVAGTGLTGGGTSGSVTLNVAGGTYTPYNDIRSLGVEAFTNGANPNITTAQVMDEIDTDGGFDSYSSVFKTSWSYAGNYNLTDAGDFTETAGSSWITWTDNSSDSTRGNITTLAIAPNTGGSAGGVFIYNNQGGSYSPGWRQVWTSMTDGAGSGLDADLLDGQQGSYYLDYANFTGTPTIPSVGNGQIDGRTSGLGLSGSMDATANQSGNTTFTVTSNAATAATASTIAYRTTSGDLNVRLLRSNYQDQTTISGAMAFRVNNGSDNYTRYCSSPSAIRTFLGVPASGDLNSYLLNTTDTFTGTLTVDNSSFGDVLKVEAGTQDITTNFVGPTTGSGLNNIISTGGKLNIGTLDAQEFNLTTNSLSRITILSDGKVGINNTSPGYQLDVDGGIGDGVKIKAGNAASKDSLLVSTNNDVSKFLVQGDGKVIINSGTGVPTRTENFQVFGRQIITNTGTDGPSLDLGYNSSGSVRLQLGRGRTADGLAYMDFNGEVMSAGSYGFRIIRNSGANAVTQLNQVGTGNLQINASNSANTVFTNTKVGVGTTTPGAKFHIEDPTVYMATPPDVFKISQRGPEITIQDLSDYVAVDTKYKSSGNTTIATHTVQSNPGGAFYKTTFDSGSTGGTEMRQGQNSFHWKINSSSEKLTIATNGNIGINDTTPSYNLDVNGNGRFTSTVTATNFILSSDERLKENIEKVCDNRVKANWKTFELKTDKGQKRYGVIAQELEKTNPEFVREDVDGFKSVAYIDLLIAKIAELEARLEKLEK